MYPWVAWNVRFSCLSLSCVDMWHHTHLLVFISNAKGMFWECVHIMCVCVWMNVHGLCPGMWKPEVGICVFIVVSAYTFVTVSITGPGSLMDLPFRDLNMGSHAWASSPVLTESSPQLLMKTFSWITLFFGPFISRVIRPSSTASPLIFTLWFFENFLLCLR